MGVVSLSCVLAPFPDSQAERARIARKMGVNTNWAACPLNASGSPTVKEAGKDSQNFLRQAGRATLLSGPLAATYIGHGIFDDGDLARRRPQVPARSFGQFTRRFIAYSQRPPRVYLRTRSSWRPKVVVLCGILASSGGGPPIGSGQWMMHSVADCHSRGRSLDASNLYSGKFRLTTAAAASVRCTLPLWTVMEI